MKKFTTIVAAGLLTAFMLTGCGNTDSNTTDTGASTTQSQVTTSAEVNTSAEADENGAKAILDKMTSVLGKEDTEVTKAFGEGTANESEDKTLLGRDYNLKFLKEDVVASINYGDDKKVSYCIIPLAGTDVDSYEKELEKELGKYQSIVEDKNNEEGNGKKGYTWVTDNATIILSTVFGAVSIEVNPIS